MVGNKIDEENADQYVKEFSQRFPDIELIPISAVLEENISLLRAGFLHALYND